MYIVNNFHSPEYSVSSGGCSSPKIRNIHFSAREKKYLSVKREKNLVFLGPVSRDRFGFWLRALFGFWIFQLPLLFLKIFNDFDFDSIEGVYLESILLVSRVRGISSTPWTHLICWWICKLYDKSRRNYQHSVNFPVKTRGKPINFNHWLILLHLFRYGWQKIRWHNYTKPNCVSMKQDNYVNSSSTKSLC